MKTCAAIICALLVSLAPARAGFGASDLGAISATPAPDAALPLDLGFRNELGHTVTLREALHGSPGVIMFADYTCHTLCGPILQFAADGLAKSGLRPNADYRLIAIGLDPKDGLDAARAMKADHFGADEAVKQAAVFLTGTATTIDAATTALGYHYRYDRDHDQFAHPAAAYIADSSGRVRRVLSGLGLDGADLKLALVDAGQGAVGTLTDRIRLLCYGYDPVRGIYTERITLFLTLAAGASVLLLGGGVFSMLALERRRTR